MDQERTDRILLNAVQNSHAEAVKTALRDGADADSSPDGTPPLVWAAYNGSMEIVLLLLEHGADPNALDQQKRTPKYYADLKGHKGIVALLQEWKYTPSPKEYWTLNAPDTVIKSKKIRSANTRFKLTEIFNFQSRERTIIHLDLDTKAQSSQTQGFDEIKNRDILKEAYDKFSELGGKADPEIINSSATARNKRGLPGIS